MNKKRKNIAQQRYLAYALCLSLWPSYASSASFSKLTTQPEVYQTAAAGQKHSCMAAPPHTERCFGIAPKGKNHCASPGNQHTCAGLSVRDYDPQEWQYVPQGSCANLKNNIKSS